MSTQTESTARSRGVRFPIGGMLSGAVAGLGVLILLQQFAVVYPTRVLAIAGIVAGAVIAFLIVNLVAATGRRPAPVASAPSAEAAPAEATTATGWAPTHNVVAGGTSAYEQPDASLEPVPLDGGLDVTVIGRDGAWAEIRCSNDWTAWVDGATLQERAADG